MPEIVDATFEETGERAPAPPLIVVTPPHVALQALPAKEAAALTLPPPESPPPSCPVCGKDPHPSGYEHLNGTGKMVRNRFLRSVVSPSTVTASTTLIDSLARVP